MSASDKDTGEFLFCKISKRQCNEISCGLWREYLSYIDESKEAKPHVGWGGKCYGMCSNNVYYGYRKNPRGCDVGIYAFHKEVTDAEKRILMDGISKMVTEMERVSLRAI